MKDPVEAAEAMSDFCNNMTMDEKKFVETMNNQHRTLQQTFSSLCFAWIRKCAENHENKRFDLRNEHSCRVSSKIVQEVEDVRFKAPFI